MMKQLKQLDNLAQNLSALPEAVGLIGLGSVGKELGRLDEFSDLDFFVVVKDGSQSNFLQDLSWLETPEAKLVYHFQNTSDGCKVLWGNGLYGEFAVFEEKRLATVIGAGARIIWAREETTFDTNFEKNIPSEEESFYDFEEALTNLYVAKLRYMRGEILSANVFMTSALDNTMKGLSKSQTSQGQFVDKFAKSRRFEQNFPEFAPKIQEIFGNLRDFDTAAHQLLTLIEENHPVNAAFKQAILDLLA